MGSMGRCALAVFLLYNFIDLAHIAILQPVLPRLLRQNCSQIQCTEDAEFQTGIILGLFYSPSLITGIPIGILASKFNCHVLFVIGLVIHAIATLLLSFLETFIPLCVVAIIFGIGSVIALVSSSKLMAAEFPDEKQRCRMIHACYLCCTFGCFLSFFIGTWAYERLGKEATFASITLGYIVIICIYIASTRRQILENNQASDAEKSSLIIKQVENTPVSHKTHFTAAQSVGLPFVAASQIVVGYMGLAVVASTGPTFLQSTLGISPVENGLILAISSLIDFSILILVTIFVNNNRRRWICLLCFFLIQSVGFAAYPFVTNVYLATLAETGIRSAKAVVMALGHSVIFTIVDVLGIGDYSKVSALYVICKHLGYISGSFTAPPLVSMIGFDKLYFALSAFGVPVAFASVSYTRLTSKSIKIDNQVMS